MNFWMDNWISDSESPWSIFQKFMFANALNYSGFIQELKSVKSAPSNWNKFKILIDIKIDIEALELIQNLIF